MPPDAPPPPPPPDSDGRGRSREPGFPRWSIWVLLGVVVALLVLPSLFRSSEGEEVGYGEFLTALEDDKIDEAQYNNTNGHITGKFDSEDNGLVTGVEFRTTGPLKPTDE